MMAIAALLATSSSVNANLFSPGNVTALLARQELFPPLFGRRWGFGGPSGLVITATLVLVLANVFDVTAIASIGSAVAMVIFLLVGVAGLRLREQTRSSTAVIVIAMALTTLVLVLFSIDTLEKDPGTFVAAVVFALLALVLDRLSTRARNRRPPVVGSAAASS